MEGESKRNAPMTWSKTNICSSHPHIIAYMKAFRKAHGTGSRGVTSRFEFIPKFLEKPMLVVEGRTDDVGNRLSALSLGQLQLL